MSQHKGRKIGDLTVEEYEDVIKVYNADIYDKIVKLNNEVNNLKEDNAKITLELNEWKRRTALLERDLAQVDKRQRRTNVIFKGLTENVSPKAAVEEVCAQLLSVTDIEVKGAKKTFQRDGKMSVVVELSDENMVSNVLKNAPKLRNSSISVDRDLTRDARQKKAAMMTIKRDLAGIDNTKKIIVRDDRMRVENQWFYWNGEKQLMSGNSDGKAILSNIFNGNSGLNGVNLEFNRV
ncbi:hypothetical protein ACFFRR_001155 [Megaselia abdita]